MNADKKAVVLLSGGMDSSVVAAMAMKDQFQVHALTFSYGQRHRVELKAAKRVVRALGIPVHKIISLDTGIFMSSALTEELPVPTGKDAEDTDGIPSTYVPARNTVFLSLALAYAESVGATDIFIGVSSVDYSGYPDCRPEFIASFEKTANLGTRAADGGKSFRIQAPLQHLTKEQTALAAEKLGLDLEITHSCYDPSEDGTPCGVCASCLLRKKGIDGKDHV